MMYMLFLSVSCIWIPFPFFPPKYCRVRGWALHSGLGVRRNGSTPLRKLWVTVQRVATSMRQITDHERDLEHGRSCVWDISRNAGPTSVYEP
jgi:hypothetical protein